MSTKESKDSSAIARGVANESKTPRTDQIRIVLGLNKCIENGDASVGHVMALLNHAETLESDLAAAHARIAELEAAGVKYLDAKFFSRSTEVERNLECLLDKQGESHAQIKGMYPAHLHGLLLALRHARLHEEKANAKVAELEAEREGLRKDAIGPLNDALIEILGRPNFQCAGIAELLRIRGDSIAHKSEAEQAAAIHFLLGFYMQYGPEWKITAGAELKRLSDVLDAAIAAKEPRDA